MQINVEKDLENIDFNKSISDYLIEKPLALSTMWTVKKATQFLRSLDKKVELRYFYVTDPKGKLAGVISSHHLLMAKEDMMMADAMHLTTINVPCHATVSEAAKMLKDHQITALPVVDDEGILVGVVELTGDVDTSSKHIPLQEKKERYNDIFQMIGFSLAKAEKKGPWVAFCLRFPWLLGNLAAGLLCALIAHQFQQVLSQVILLALFIPLVLTLNESVSMQSMTLSLYLIHRKKIPWKEVAMRLLEEWKTVLLLGSIAGLTVELVAFFMQEHTLPYFVIAVSIFVSMIITATMGVITPVLVHFFKLDPKIAAGPIALMFADMLATAIYLGLATWWIL